MISTVGLRQVVMLLINALNLVLGVTLNSTVGLRRRALGLAVESVHVLRLALSTWDCDPSM